MPRLLLSLALGLSPLAAAAQAPEEVARAFYAALDDAAGPVEAATSLIAPDFVDHDPQLSGMWDDLPVVQVRNWSEVTPRYLRATWHTMRDRQYNLAKVYFPYWLHASLSAD